MKKQNRIHTFALSMMMTGLSVMPVWAFSGQIDSGALDTVLVSIIVPVRQYPEL